MVENPVIIYKRHKLIKELTKLYNPNDRGYDILQSLLEICIVDAETVSLNDDYIDISKHPDSDKLTKWIRWTLYHKSIYGYTGQQHSQCFCMGCKYYSVETDGTWCGIEYDDKIIRPPSDFPCPNNEIGDAFENATNTIKITSFMAYSRLKVIKERIDGLPPVGLNKAATDILNTMLFEEFIKQFPNLKKCLL